MATELYGTLNQGTRRRHQPLVMDHNSNFDEELHDRRRQLLKEFSYRMKLLLTESDQDYLLAALKEYQMYNQLEKMIHCMRAVLDTPAKLDLLRDVRYFISPTQLMQYDNLVPYHKMAHPWKLSGMATMPRSRSRSHHVHVLTTPQRTPKMKPRIVNGMTEVLANDPAPLKVVTISKDESEPLGFSIRGGSEHGLGIFVSEVEHETAAEHAGLVAGDNVIEVNSVSFDNISSGSAVKVLTGSHRLKMIVRRVNKIPGFKSAKEKILWYDVARSSIMEGNFVEHGTFHHPIGSDDNIERRINLTGNKNDHQFLGFNMRGGSEYGLGIYVSKVDAGGLAEEHGLQVGDQILKVNGHSLLKVTHGRAVDAVQSQRRLMLTVKDVGKYPAFKEIFAEYQWLDTLTGKVTKTCKAERKQFRSQNKKSPNGVGEINSVPVRPSPQNDSTHHFTEFPLESHVESYANDESDDELELKVPISYPMDVGIQTESDNDSRLNLLPNSQDIELRVRQPEGSEKLQGRNRLKEDTARRPTLAVRAMEIEARKKYPELAQEWDMLTPEQRQARIYSRDDIDLDFDLAEYGNRSKSLFGSKSKESRVKSATQAAPSQQRKKDISGGANQSKSWKRKPLTNLNFMKKSHQQENASCFEHGMGGQLNIRDCMVQKSYNGVVEDSANRLLSNQDEITAVFRHVKLYEKQKNLEELLSPLLAILDTHEKLQMLRDIRCVIHPVDLADYDWTVVNQEQLYLRQQVMKQSPTRQLSPQHGTPSSNMSGRTPLYKSTREEEYKKQIEALQRLQQEENAEKFTRVHLKHSSRLTALDGQLGVEEIIVPDEQDANYDYEIHRYQSNSRVYKGDHMHELSGDSVDSVNVKTGGISDDVSENVDMYHYCDIAEVRDASSLITSDMNSKRQLNQENSSSKTQSNSSPLVSPVYAVVKKHGRNAHSDTSRSEINETDSNLQQKGSSAPNTSKSEDYWDTQSETYLQAKKALNFLDDLEGDEEDDDDDGPSPPLPSTSWSSHSDTPVSEASSLNESRSGSYDVNLSVSGSPPAKTTHNIDRSPPRFVPPPPPSNSPPPESLDDWTTEDQMYISDIKYVKRQTSYDYSEYPLSGNLQNNSGSSGSRESIEESKNSSLPRGNPGFVGKEDNPGFLASADSIHSGIDGAADVSTIEVQLWKTHASLGFSISGGIDSKSQPDILIDKVFPGGAASAQGHLEAGMVILSIDGFSLKGVTHRQAVEVIRKTFSNKQPPTMLLRLSRILKV